jgi:uncharacterized membrane protein
MASRTSPADDVVPDKQPVSVVAGPYGHPFHPVMVAVPIGAWISSVVLDFASHAVDDPGGLVRGAFWLVGIGIIGAVLAAVFGLLDLMTIPRGTKAFRTGVTHMALNVVVLVLFVISYLIRRDDGFDQSTSATALTLSVIAIVLLGASGWLGGQLAYRYGVRVARETTQAEGYRP